MFVHERITFCKLLLTCPIVTRFGNPFIILKTELQLIPKYTVYL